MASGKDVVSQAKLIVEGGKYTYGQSRAEGYLDDDIMDCSEFVYHSYRNAGYANFPAHNSEAMLKNFKELTDSEVQAGDIVYWPGHVAIVDDPTTGKFLGAQSKKSGLRFDNYITSPYWSKRTGRKFLRYQGA